MKMPNNENPRLLNNINSSNMSEVPTKTPFGSFSKALIGVCTLVACSNTTPSTQPQETVSKVSLALSGPDMVKVPYQATVGESTGTRLITFLDAFSLDSTEVTVSQYADCVTATACTAPDTTDNCNWGVSGHEQHPVNCVTYLQAADYCAWAGKRLPTQQEWEYVARYNDGRTYPWGSSTSGYATKTNTNSGDSYTYTAPVGSFPDGDSALGLKDLSGNVWEWTQSPACFNEEGPCTNCPEGQTCANACDVCEASDRTYRGGSYSMPLSYSRSAYRSYGSQDAGNAAIGFRCALTR